MDRQGAERHAGCVLTLGVVNQRIVDFVLHGVEARVRQARRQIAVTDRRRIKNRCADRVTECGAIRRLCDGRPRRGIGGVKSQPVSEPPGDRIGVQTGQRGDGRRKRCRAQTDIVGIERGVGGKGLTQGLRCKNRWIEAVSNGIGDLSRQKLRREKGEGVRRWRGYAAGRYSHAFHERALRHRYLRQGYLTGEQLSGVGINGRPVGRGRIDRRHLGRRRGRVGEESDSELQRLDIGLGHWGGVQCHESVFRFLG